MENVGAVTFTENYIPRGIASESRKQTIADTILHELAHMWFGNLVTIDWWNALWLKEGFASYMAPLALSEATQYKSAWHRFNFDIKQYAYKADQRVTTHPIYMDILDTKSGEASYDAITYEKGASVLQQLAHYLGEDTFRDGIRHYLKNHKNQATTLPDFINSLKNASGKELDNWKTTWINTPGVNTLMADYQCKQGRISQFKIQQSAPKEHPQLRSHRVQIGLYQKDEQKQLVATTVVPVTIAGKTTDIAPLIGLDCPLLVYPNHDDWGYLKVQLDKKTLLMLPENIISIKDDLLRAMLWQSLWDMVRDLQMPLTQYLELTLRSITYERDPENIIPLLANIVQSSQWLVKNKNRNDAQIIMNEIELLMLQQIQDQVDGTEQQKAWFSAFLTVAKSELSLKHLSTWLQGNSSPQILANDQDRRWQALITLSRNNHPDTTILLNREKRRDTSDNGLMMAMAVEASSNNLEIKKYWLDELTKKEQRQSAARLKNAMSYLFPANQTDLHKQFAESIIEDIHYLDEHRGQTFVEHMVGYILPNLCSQESVELLFKSQQNMGSLGLIAQKGIKIAHQENQRCVNINKLIQ